MKPSITLATTTTPNGATLECISHDGEMYLYVDRQPICSTRACEPELALAYAGCSRIAHYRNPVILIIGLGLGHCLQETLTLAPPKSHIHMVEPTQSLIEWNKTLLGADASNALRDTRLQLHTCSITAFFKKAPSAFDAIIFSEDPGLHQASSNALRQCVTKLNPKGCLHIKSTREKSARISAMLKTLRLQTTVVPVGARPNARTRTHAIISAAQKQQYLPAT